MNTNERKYILEVTEKLLNNPLCVAFVYPISRNEEWSADYFSIIKKPMDLSTIKTNIENDSYDSIEEWKADVMQVWENSKLFNGKGALLYVCADFMAKKCTNKYFVRVPRTEMDISKRKIEKLNKKIQELTSMELSQFSLAPRTPI